MKILSIFITLTVVLYAEYQPCINIENDTIVFDKDKKETNKRLQFREFYYSNLDNDNLQNLYINCKTQKEHRYCNNSSRKYQYIGWVDKKNLVCGKFKKTKVETEKLQDENGNDINLHSKVLVVNNIGKNSDGFDKISLSDRSNKGNSFGKLSVNDIFFNLKEKNNKILLSSSSTIRYSQVSNIRGWIEKDNILFWDNRIGLNPEIGAKFWESEDSRIGRALFIQTIKLNYNEVRPPLLENNVNGRIGVTKVNRMTDNSIFSESRQNITDAINQKYINMVFLIDATQGMEDYIKNIRDGITLFLRSKQKSNLKIAIAIYRDYMDNVPFKLLTNGFETPSKALKYLNKRNIDAHSSSKDNINTLVSKGYSQSQAKDISKLESMFSGISKTIISLRSDFEKSKMDSNIIIIGDHGNHQNNQREKINSIVSKLKKHNIILNAVMINTPSFTEYNTIFKNQIKTIQRLNRERGFFNSSDGASSKDINRTIAKISQDFAKGQKLILRCVDTAMDCERLKNILTKEGAFEKFLRGQGSKNLFIDRSEDKFKSEVLMKKTTLDSLKSILGYFIKIKDNDEINDIETRDLLESNMKFALKALSGEDIKNFDESLNIQELLVKKAGFPENDKSLLNYKLMDLLRKLRDIKKIDFTYSYFKELKLKYNRLNDLYIEKYCENYTWYPANEKYECNNDKVDKLSKHNISIKKSKKGRDWVWVPLKYLP